MKRSLNIGDMKIKYTRKCHLTLIRMAIFEKSTNNKCWRGCGGKGSLLHCWWECKLIQPLWRTVWRFLKKLGIKLPYDPRILLLGMYSEKTIIEIDTCPPKFISAVFTISRMWKQSRCPTTGEWIKKLWYIYKMEYYSAIRGMHESVLIRWINLDPIIQNEVSQKEKYIYVYKWNLERWYWWTYLGLAKQTDIENRFVDTVGEEEGRMNWKSTIEAYTLTYVKY